MNILVTGASGFVASYLVPALLELGHHVTAMGGKNQPQYAKAQNVHGSLDDVLFLRKVTANQDVVFHLAASMLSKPSQKSELFTTNILGTENLVKACEENKVKKIIFTSSTVALGASLDGSTLVSESFQNQIKDWEQLLNAQAKRQAETLIRNSKLEWNIIYSGLIYGARDWQKNIRKANKPIIKGRMPFYFSGGVNINSVESFVDGLLRVLEKGVKNQSYVLGGENISNETFFKLLAESARQKAPQVKFPDSLLRGLAKINSVLKLDSSLNSESIKTLLAYHWCDSSKAQKELGYLPGQAKIAITNSTNWILKNDEL